MSSSTAIASEIPFSPAVHHQSTAAQSTVAESTADADGQNANWSTRLARRIVHSRLSHCASERLTIHESGSHRTFGNQNEARIAAEITVHDPAFYSAVIRGGSMGAAESYMRGEWSSDNLSDFFRVLLRNEQVLGRLQTWAAAFMRQFHRAMHYLQDNSRKGSRRNIRRHYDLGNDFFQLFLDPSMMYSSAWFNNSSVTLEQASWEKVDRACRSLNLSADDHVVEIGTGWGGFAIHAARHYGCRVTTTTISDEQFRFASDRVRRAGLSERITLLKQDYRDLSGTFDKLVSIEMIEAVGDRHLPEYFARCDQLLKPEGSMLIQAITMPEQRFDKYRNSVDFIQKYIFPGGFLPSIERMQQIVGKVTALRMLQCVDFGHHYAKTLRHWSDRFHQNLPEVRSLGFDDQFIRMWRYYLHYCEAAFLERATGVVQTVWAKPQSSLGQMPV